MSLQGKLTIKFIINQYNQFHKIDNIHKDGTINMNELANSLGKTTESINNAFKSINTNNNNTIDIYEYIHFMLNTKNNIGETIEEINNILSENISQKDYNTITDIDYFKEIFNEKIRLILIFNYNLSSFKDKCEILENILNSSITYISNGFSKNIKKLLPKSIKGLHKIYQNTKCKTNDEKFDNNILSLGKKKKNKNKSLIISNELDDSINIFIASCYLVNELNCIINVFDNNLKEIYKKQNRFENNNNITTLKNLLNNIIPQFNDVSITDKKNININDNLEQIIKIINSLIEKITKIFIGIHSDLSIKNDNNPKFLVYKDLSIKKQLK
jgi:hypothetical protein